MGFKVIIQYVTYLSDYKRRPKDCLFLEYFTCVCVGFYLDDNKQVPPKYGEQWLYI